MVSIMVNIIPEDLLLFQSMLKKYYSLECSPAIKELESEEYGAHDFLLKDLAVKFRIAKITPTKTGQFVTLWKRSKKGPIEPYDLLDSIDLIIINARKDDLVGQFVFPKNLLVKQGIFSKNGKGGKRALRIYPPWDITESQQAQKTQSWQLDYFLETIHEKPKKDYSYLFNR